MAQTLKTPSGETLVVLDQEEFDRLNTRAAEAARDPDFLRTMDAIEAIMGTLVEIGIVLDGMAESKIRGALTGAVQDAADAAHAAEAMRRVAAGEIETLDADEAIALAEAPTPLAFWRRKRGLTQSALADAASISQNYVSQLEAGARKGDAELVLKLARALHVRMEDLVDG